MVAIPIRCIVSYSATNRHASTSHTRKIYPCNSAISTRHWRDHSNWYFLCPTAITPQRYSLMEMALACPLTDIQLTWINCVRMYLGVTYLSEICTPDGLSISPGILNRTRDIDKYKTKLTRPYQMKPNTRSWDLWDQIILPKTRANNKTLIQPLQQWTTHHSKAGIWKAYMHSTGNVYTRTQTTQHGVNIGRLAPNYIF